MYHVSSANSVFVEIFSGTPHPMYVYDVQTLCFLAANPAACAKYGYSEEEFRAMTIEAIREPEEARRLRKTLAEPHSQVVGRGRWQHRRKDGATIHADVTSYAIDYDGRPAQLVLAVDVTDQVLAAERAQRNIRQLEEALQSTTNALSAMGEVRDPYTAGHQARVSGLAAAIAREMGCDESMHEGLKVMGLLHDVGKIGIPVDILSKPAELKEQEYELVKTHAQTGYEILSAIAFKWPVAEVVLQHHERMDGSGYPNGLRGADIRIESRILAVADVVESMSCHRPYRVGLGVTSALDEISRGAGSLYDAQAAQACVRLFKMRGYQLH
jgi:PAS domain S-box-containing protein/putative nucleotidyltransferase with HDIG domain